jgi:hypothetical protein
VGPYRPARWQDDFEDVKELWTATGAKLLRIFYDHWYSTGRDLHRGRKGERPVERSVHRVDVVENGARRA